MRRMMLSANGNLSILTVSVLGGKYEARRVPWSPPIRNEKKHFSHSYFAQRDPSSFFIAVQGSFDGWGRSSSCLITLDDGENWGAFIIKDRNTHFPSKITKDIIFFLKTVLIRICKRTPEKESLIKLLGLECRTRAVVVASAAIAFLSLCALISFSLIFRFCYVHVFSAKGAPIHYIYWQHISWPQQLIHIDSMKNDERRRRCISLLGLACLQDHLYSQ